MPDKRVALLLRIRKDLKDRLTDLAKGEHRSLNQQIEFILDRFLSEKIDRAQRDQQRRSGGPG